MKSLDNFINEKLKINSKMKINTHRDDWTINDAENGDLIDMPEINLVFLYKCLNDDDEILAPKGAIIYHAYYLYDNRKRLTVKESSGVGKKSDFDKVNYQLASDELSEEFFDALEKNGYKWDNTKKEIIKL